MKTMYSETKKAFGAGGMKLVKKMDKKLGLSEIIRPLKSKGMKLDKIVNAVLSEWATGTESILHTTKEIKNNDVLLEEWEIEEKNIRPKTFYRALKILGKNSDKIFKALFESVNEEFHLNMKTVISDWTTSFFHGNKCDMAEHGYSKDNEPGKQQVKIGVAMFGECQVPFHHSVVKGSTHDSPHFKEDYEKYKDRVPKNAIIIFDKGGNSKEIRKKIKDNEHDYLTAVKNTRSIKEKLKKIDPGKNMRKVATHDSGEEICARAEKNGDEFLYYFFDEKRANRERKKRERKLEKKLEEKRKLEKLAQKKGWKHVQGKLSKTKTKTKKLNEVVVKTKVTVQKRLLKKTDEELKEEIVDDEKDLDGKFVLRSSKKIDPKKALDYYRKKNKIEKLISDLKSVLMLRPFRVWNELEVLGAVLLKIICVLFVSLIQIEFKELKGKRRKTVVSIIQKLTVVVGFGKNDEMITQEYVNISPLLAKILELPT